MDRTPIHDLDELVLTVRDKKARSYILEAIHAYRGGAYRSAIVSIWIAVSSDLISKIRELGYQNDSNAVSIISTLDKAIATKHIPTLQKIEESLLQKAKDEFEFISEQQYLDLLRLKEDRNFCAHPAYVGEEELFEPEPERVRMYIVLAIKHLLQHEPIQGKAALSRMLADVNSQTFPSLPEDAYLVLNKKYLDRAKKALIFNFLDCLLKSILNAEVPAPDKLFLKNKALAIKAVARRHPAFYEERLKLKLPLFTEHLQEDKLPNLFRLIGTDIRCWFWIKEPTQIQLKNIITHPSTKPYVKQMAFYAIEIEELQPILLPLFNTIIPEMKVAIIKAIPKPQFVDHAIQIYANAEFYRNAEYRAQVVILPPAHHFSVDQVRKTLRVLKENPQLWDASGMPPLIREFYQLTKQHLPYLKTEWKELLEFLKIKGHVSHSLHADVSYKNTWNEVAEILMQDGIPFTVKRYTDDEIFVDTPGENSIESAL